LASVRRELGRSDSASGRKYLRGFTQAFRRYDSTLTSQQFDAKLAAADILLAGDYHALPTSQRFAAELVEKQAQSRKVVLGVEAVLARDQRILDAWWRREIGETELRQRLRFDREWGYDWTSFYQLLVTGREHAEGIYGLDCMPRHDLRRIGSRDRHAAAKIVEMRERHPDGALIVVFGESHMAPRHLPRMLQERLPQERLLTVLQNVDALYWQSLGENAYAVGIEESAVCVFNSSPLEKYETYRMCFERWNAAADDAPDFAPAIYNLIFSLAKCLGFRLDSPRNGTQPKFLADSLPEVVCDTSLLSGEALKAMEEHGCVYVPEKNTFFIREFQAVHASREAARFLHCACRGMTAASQGALAVEQALVEFGGKLLCPTADLSNSQNLGAALYQAFLDGRVGRAALRRTFLTHLDDSSQAKSALADLSALVNSHS
jgi:hypothetical protein